MSIDCDIYNSEAREPSNIAQNFKFGPFISMYKKDDLEEKIKKLIIEIIYKIKDEYYEHSLKNKETTSISNFLKSDKICKEKILYSYINNLKLRDNLANLLKYCGEIFRRPKL